mgnify:FL=1|jgi:Holliday junction resolvasome RuvABC endonuclease subunit
MILGLDISTSITGFSVVNYDGTVLEIGHWDTRSKTKFDDFYDKALFIRNKIKELDYPIDHIFIEPALNMFMMGKSSSHTISTLTKFNGILSWICYEEFGIKPEYIPAISARKKCGITIKRGQKAKEQVIAFLLDNEPLFNIQYTKTGKPKPYCYDEADSLIIAKAGLVCLKEKQK